MTLVEQLEEAIEAMNRLVVSLRNDGKYPSADRWIVRTRAVEEAVEKLRGMQSVQPTGVSPTGEPSR